MRAHFRCLKRNEAAPRPPLPLPKKRVILELMRLSCIALYERVLEYFPCQSWLWPVSQDDLQEPILQPPLQSLSDCWVPPRACVSAVHLPQSSCHSWHGRQLQSAGSSAGSWDIDACPADGCSTPKICITASREHKGVTTGRDTQDASEGIELRPAKTNVLLGQYYLERSGQFVGSKPGCHARPDGQPSGKAGMSLLLEGRRAA